MGVIFSIMEEEYERLKVLIASYKAAIAQEAKGTPILKRRGYSYYLYLQRREGPKVVSEYVGNVESDKAVRISKSIKQRKEYELLLKKAKADLKDVKKVLRGKI